LFRDIILGTAPIEDAINEHPAIAESAIVGFPHDIKGNALYGFVILKETGEYRDRDNLSKEINQQISDHIGPIAKLIKYSLFLDYLKHVLEKSCVEF
jgi:acetyl-CoA synthetase